MIGIYKITNKINGKTYVGSTSNAKQRKIDHFKDSTIEDRGHLPLYKDMIKYGKENFIFEVIEECSEDNLLELEDYYLAKYKTYENGYNVSSRAVPMHDEKISNEHGNRMREWNLEQWQDEDYRKMKSEASSKLQKERLKDPEYLAEKSRQLKQYTDSIKKPIGQYDKQGNLIAEYEGVRVAERETGVNSSTISAVALGGRGRKSAGGYVWKFL